MLPVFQSLLADPASLLPLTYTGEAPDGRWTGGELASPNWCRVYKVKDGIPDFVGDSCGWLRLENMIEQARAEEWVLNNWRKSNQRYANLDETAPDLFPNDRMTRAERRLWFEICARAAREPGSAARAGSADRPVILELAAGPGGGNLVPLLLHDPEAQVLLLDILRPTLEDWQRVLAAEKAGPNVSCVVADACQLPLASGSIDVVSGAIPFSEVQAAARAVAEAYRVLRPGGLIFFNEFALLEEAASLPEPVRAAYEIAPVYVHGPVPFLRQAGFTDIDDQPGSTFELDPGEGDKPALAARYGLRLHVQFHYVTARKPGLRATVPAGIR